MTSGPYDVYWARIENVFGDKRCVMKKYINTSSHKPASVLEIIIDGSNSIRDFVNLKISLNLKSSA